MITGSFPDIEKFGLSTQLQRASVSVSSNIAEGSGRQTNPDFKRFLSYSMGSLYEIESQLTIAKELKYIQVEDYESILNEVTEIQKMTHSLRSKL